MDEKVDFEAFVQTRTQPLLRTAYLLVGDEQRAEDLLVTALAKAWFAWRRIEWAPEAYVRRVMVTTSVSWCAGAGTVRCRRPSCRRLSGPHRERGPRPRPLAGAAPPASTSARAVVVLRYLEDRSERETAQLPGCSLGTVKSQTARALAKLRLDPSLDAPPRSEPAETEGGQR